MVIKTAAWNEYPGECEYCGLSVRHRAAKGDVTTVYAMYLLDTYPFQGEGEE